MLTLDFPDRIESGRIALRRFSDDDLGEAYIGWLNDPVVTRFSNQRFRRHDRTSCEAYLASFTGSPNLFLSIRSRETDAALGTMTAYAIVQHGTVDVGIMLGERSAWGTGIGEEAWTALVEWLLAQPGVRKVTAGTLAVNQAMIRLAEKSGMALEGRRLRQEICEGEAVDVLYFGKFSGAP